ncbi:MAG: hypothetical protein ACT443_04885, partial [Gemmatimonadota bacterium]
IVMNRVLGTPESGLSGEVVSRGENIARIWAPANYNRKPTGMLALDGDGDGRDELYLAVQDLNSRPCPACFNDAPNASISQSTDFADVEADGVRILGVPGGPARYTTIAELEVYFA